MSTVAAAESWALDLQDSPPHSPEGFTAPAAQCDLSAVLLWPACGSLRSCCAHALSSVALLPFPAEKNPDHWCFSIFSTCCTASSRTIYVACSLCLLLFTHPCLNDSSIQSCFLTTVDNTSYSKVPKWVLWTILCILAKCEGLQVIGDELIPSRNYDTGPS